MANGDSMDDLVGDHGVLNSSLEPDENLELLKLIVPLHCKLLMLLLKRAERKAEGRKPKPSTTNATEDWTVSNPKGGPLLGPGVTNKNSMWQHAPSDTCSTVRNTFWRTRPARVFCPLCRLKRERIGRMRQQRRED